MAYIEREERLTRIFAKTNEGDRLIAAIHHPQEGTARFSGSEPTLYDLGDNKTYLPAYILGGGPARSRIIHESPRALQKAFIEAGVPISDIPGIKKSPVRSAIHRVATFFFPQKESHPAYKSR